MFNSTIPESFFHLDKQVMDSIDLSSNFFHGTIPESFGQIMMLTFLNLSHNSFDCP